MTHCPSTFYGAPCQLPAGHPGDNHYHFDTSHHRTTWQTNATDPKATP